MPLRQRNVIGIGGGRCSVCGAKLPWKPSDRHGQSVTFSCPKGHPNRRWYIGGSNIGGGNS